MVMHARKLPRINDGFSDKHQNHSAYESSKYGSGSKYRGGGSQAVYTGTDKRDSPSANSLRSSSPDSRSQSPRYHKSSSSYYKREREYSSREHNRDNRDGSRSPKERRRDRHSEHSSSRNSSMKKDGGTTRVGDWSEHVSSNGKKYYYNCKSEKSQWEKPQDWLDWESHHNSRHNKLGAHYNNSKPSYSSSSIVNSNKVGSYNSVNSSSQYNSSSKGGGGGSNYSSSYSNSKNSSFITPTSSANKSSSSVSNNNSHSHHHGHHSSHHSHHNNSNSSSKERSLVLQEKLKIDKHSNIESRDNHFREDHHYDKRKYSGQDMEISSGGSTPTSENRLHGTDIGASHMPLSSNRHSKSSAQANSNSRFSSNNSGDPRHHHFSNTEAINSSNSGQTGPPTPTHSESHDHMDVRKGENCLPSRLGTSSITSSASSNFPGSNNHTSTTSVNNFSGGVTPTLSSLSSLPPSSSQAGGWGTSPLSSSLTCQRPLHPPPALTPSLSKYYNEGLISHVKEWPAENLERQCQRLSEEVHTAGSIIMTKVSADLKMARSLVRLAEIQATLHEQRVLFLRAQKRELEDLGVRSQNSFMGGEPSTSTTTTTSNPPSTSNNHHNS